MPELITCPSRQVLQDFLLGRLGDDAAAPVDHHLEQCEHCCSELDACQERDPLSDAVRQRTPLLEEPEPEPLAALVRRLQTLCPALAGETLPPEQSATGKAAANPTGPDQPSPIADGGVPEQVAHYQIRKLLGEGGMGLVYLAEDLVLRRPVALKVMRPALTRNDQAQQRFLREAQAMAALKSDHVVTVHHVGQDGATAFLAMELLEGESLESRLGRPPGLALTECVRIAREAALGLAAAHRRGLIHRDVKPSNLWLEAGTGRVKVLDFGLARPVEGAAITQSGAILGTPAYMAPEQARGDKVDGRADLFSLGCVLYQLTTGRRPFKGRDTLALLAALALDTPEPVRALNVTVPPALAELIDRLLAKDPAQRSGSAVEVVQALTDIGAGLASVAATPTQDEMPPKPPATAPLALSRPRTAMQRSRLVKALGVGLAAVLLIGVGLAVWWSNRAREEAARPSDGAPPAPMAFQGGIDVKVWSKAQDGRRNLGLGDFGALPLRPGDLVRIEAAVEPAAYLYLFWIDTEGEPSPVYPWQPGRWGTRPGQEQPRQQLSLPEDGAEGWPIAGAEEGMETLLLLARAEPLPHSDAELQALLGRLPPQRPVQNLRTAVWFEDGHVDPRRKPFFFQAEQIDDPVLRLQQLVRERLQPLGLTRAVSFAKTGR